jgi:hypothetical protein
MQKLYHKSIYKLCTSFRFCHQEYMKIGFAFLCFFYNFLWFLQATGPRSKETKNLLAQEPLERFKTSHKCPWVYTTVPAKIQSSQACPSAAGKSSPAAIAGRTWPTNGTKLHRCAPELDWRRRLGRSGLRWWPAVRQWPHGRHGSDSGTMRGWAKPWKAVGARVGVRE